MALVNGVQTGATMFEDTLKKTNTSDSLGKEDFLKLLVAQLTHQDPTNPVQDTEFVSQLATYSGLEQQMTMNKNLETLIAAQSLSTAASATSLIGSVISYVDEDGYFQMGQVAFLDIVGGEVNLILNDENNTSVPYSSVQQIGYPIQQVPSTPDPGDDDE
jgi:flagellar basal-body rod modification protein FlgD